MCYICSEWEKGKLTNAEALDNLAEVSDKDWKPEDVEHYLEIWQKIITKEIKEKGMI
jgi:hypothetical protein